MRKRSLRKSVLVGIAVGVVSVFILASSAKAASIKKIVAVSRFENKTSTRSEGTMDLNNGLADQLTDALIQSGQFVVLERETLGDVIQEQDMADSDRFQKSKSARTGKLTSAQILVKGTITEFETATDNSSSGISFSGFRIGGSSTSVHLGLIIRLIDSTTGQVIDSKRMEGKAKGSGMNLGVDFGGVNFGSDSFKATPLGKATQITIDKAVDFIAKKLKNVPYKGRVIKVKGNIVYISAGKTIGTTQGAMFDVYSVGEEMIDPDTGELLGVDEVKIGKIKVFDVQEKFSKAKPEGDLLGIKVGDYVQFD